MTEERKPAVTDAAKSTEDTKGSIPTQLAAGRELAAATDAVDKAREDERRAHDALIEARAGAVAPGQKPEGNVEVIFANIVAVAVDE